MTIRKNRFETGVELTPTNIEGIGGVDLTREGEIDVDSDDSRLKVRVESATRTVVTEDQTQTLTNKTINVDNNTVSNIEVDNLKAGVLNTSTTLTGASDTQVPSTLAVKTYVDNKAAAQNEASEISFTPTGTIIATDVQAAIAEVSSDIDNHISDAADAHDASAISNTPSGNLAATDVQGALNELQTDINTRVAGAASSTDDAIARFDGTTGKLIQNSIATLSDTGVLTTNEILSPLLTGGTTTTSTLTLKPTSGAGTTGSDIVFGVGSNGATEAMRIKSDGKIGVGTSSPTYKFQVQSFVTDPVSSNVNLRANVRNTDTANNSQNQYGVFAEVSTNVSSGFTNSGSNIGVYSSAVIPNGITGTGTTSQLMGVRSDYGIQTGGAGTVTSAYGLYSLLYGQTGTITNAYGLYLGTPNTGGTITNEWGVYSVSTTANNALAGKTRIGGVTAPVATVDITGTLATTGTVGIGTSVPTGAALKITPTISGGTTQYGIQNGVVFGNGTTTAGSTYWARPETTAAAFTLVDAIGFEMANGVAGSGSAMTNQTGLMIRDLTRGTNNFGIQNLTTLGANKWGYYGSGTASNYFAGAVGIGSTSINANALLDVQSTTKASMPFPRMTTIEKNAIISPTAGMVVYDTTLGAQSTYNGASWSGLSAGISSFTTIDNISFVASVGSNALTIALKNSGGTDHSGGNFGTISFRSATLTSGAYVSRDITSALSIVVSSGSTLGHVNAKAKNIWLYAIDNAGTIELAVSSTQFDETYLYSTTAEGGAGAADSESVLYSTTARSNIAIRLIGRLLSTQTTAGTWAAVPTDVSLTNHNKITVAALYTGAPPTIAGGTIDTTFRVVTYGTKVKDSHNAYSSGSYTIPTSGVYDISASAVIVGLASSVNDEAKLAIYIDGVESYMNREIAKIVATNRKSLLVSVGSIPLLSGQVITIRAYSEESTNSFLSSAADSHFSIIISGDY